MKKILLIIMIIAIYIFIGNLYDEQVIIPDDSIRIRIIANSNSEYDQSIKYIVRDELETDIYNLLKNTNDLSEARKLILENLDEIDQSVSQVLEDNNYDIPYNINFGYNYFPEKEYKNVKYNEGYYESLLVTIGDGKGDNWWCVLFPPLCIVEAEESDNVEYTSIVKELINKYN